MNPGRFDGILPAITSHEAFQQWAWSASLIVGMVCLAAFAVVAVVVLIFMLRAKPKQ
jgi:hypothetical protein